MSDEQFPMSPVDTPYAPPAPPAGYTQVGPMTFVAGAPASTSRRGPLVVAGVAALVALLVGGGVVLLGGGDKAPAAPAAKPKAAVPASKPKAVALTSNTELVVSQLKDMATAQESYHMDWQTYTKELRLLHDEGLKKDARVALTVIAASQDRYCLRARGAKDTVYFDSAKGPSRTPCR